MRYLAINSIGWLAVMICFVFTVSPNLAVAQSAENTDGSASFRSAQDVGFDRETGNFIITIPSTFQDLPFVSGMSMESYATTLYRISITLAAFLVVLRLILAGVKYMFSEVVTNKEEAKKDITQALLGLLIILAAVTLLNTINPSLTELDFFRNVPERDSLIQDQIAPPATGDLGDITDRFHDCGEYRVLSIQNQEIYCPEIDAVREAVDVVKVLGDGRNPQFILTPIIESNNFGFPIDTIFPDAGADDAVGYLEANWGTDEGRAARDNYEGGLEQIHKDLITLCEGDGSSGNELEIIPTIDIYTFMYFCVNRSSS